MKRILRFVGVTMVLLICAYITQKIIINIYDLPYPYVAGFPFHYISTECGGHSGGISVSNCIFVSKFSFINILLDYTIWFFVYCFLYKLVRKIFKKSNEN